MDDGLRPIGLERPSTGSQIVVERELHLPLRHTVAAPPDLHPTSTAHNPLPHTLSFIPAPLPSPPLPHPNSVRDAHTPDTPRARRKRPKLPAPPQARASPGPVPQPYLARAPGSITPQPELSTSGLILPSDHMRSVAASQRYATGLASPPSVMPGEWNSGSGTPRPLPTPTPPHRQGYAAGLIAPPAIIPGGRTGSPLPQVPGILPLPRPVLPHGNSSRSVNRPPLPGRRSPLPPPLDTDLAAQPQVHPGQANPTTPRRRAGGRRIVNNVALSRRPTVSSREDHLSRRASMRRVNVWDDLPDEVEPLPEFPDPSPSYVSRNPPTFSSVDPSPRSGRRQAQQRASIAADIERIAGRPDSPPPPFDEAIKSMQSPSVDDSDDDDTEEMREDRRMWNADILQGFTLEERVAREAERRAARALAQQQGTQPTGPAFTHNRGNSAVSVDASELEAIIREANGTKESSKEDLERAARQTLEILGGRRATKEEILAAARAALDAKGGTTGSLSEAILPTAPAQFVASETGPKVLTRNEEPGVYYRLVKPGGKQTKGQTSTPENASSPPTSQSNRLQPSVPPTGPNSSTVDDIASIYNMGRNQMSPSPRPPSPTLRNPSTGSVSSPPTRHDGIASPPPPTRLNSNGRSATPQFGQDERNRGVSPAFGTPGLNRSDPQLNSTNNQMTGNIAPAAASTEALLQTKKEILEALEKERPKAQDLPKPVHMTQNPVGAVVSLPEEPGIFYRLVANKDGVPARPRKPSDGTAPPLDLQQQRSHSPQLGHHRAHSGSQVPTTTSLRHHRMAPRATTTDALPRHERHGSFSKTPSNLRSTNVDDSPSARPIALQGPPAPPAAPAAPPPPPPLPPRPPLEYIAEYNAPIATPPLGTPQHGTSQSTIPPGTSSGAPQTLYGLGITRTHGSSASITSLGTPSVPPRALPSPAPLPAAPEQSATPTPPRRARLPRIPSTASAHSSPAVSNGAFSTPSGAARPRSPAPKHSGSGPTPLPPVPGDASRTPPFRSGSTMTSYTPPRVESPCPTETMRPQPAPVTVPVAQSAPRAESPLVARAVSPPVQPQLEATAPAPFTSPTAHGQLPSGPPLPSTEVMDLSSPTATLPTEDPTPRVRSPASAGPRSASQSPTPPARERSTPPPPRQQAQVALRSPAPTAPNRAQSPLPVVTVAPVPSTGPAVPTTASPQATPVAAAETPAAEGMSSVGTAASPEPQATVPLRSTPSSNSVHSMASVGSSTTPPIATSASMPALGAYSMLSAAPGSGRYGSRSGANSPEVSLDSPSSMVDNRLTPADNASIKSGSTGSTSVNHLPRVPERARTPKQGERSPNPSFPYAPVLAPQAAPAPATEGARQRPRWMPQWGSSSSSRGEANSHSKQIFGDLWRRPTNRNNTEPFGNPAAEAAAGPQHRHTHSEGAHYPVLSASPQPDDSNLDDLDETDRPQPERSASVSSTSSQPQVYSLPPGALPSALSPRLQIPSRSTDSPKSPDLALSSLYVPMPPPRAPEPPRRPSARRPGQTPENTPQLLQSPITEEPEEVEGPAPVPAPVQPVPTIVDDKEEESVEQASHVDEDVEPKTGVEKEEVEKMDEKLQVDRQEVDAHDAETETAGTKTQDEPVTKPKGAEKNTQDERVTESETKIQDEPVTGPQTEDEESEGESETESTFRHRAPAVPPSLPPLFSHSYDPGEHSSLLTDGLPSEWHSTPTPENEEPELSPNREAALLRRDLTETPGRSPRPKSVAAGKRPAAPPPPPQLLTVPAVMQLKKDGISANPPSPLNVSPEIASLAASTSALLTLLEADERPMAESSAQGAAKAAVAQKYRNELAQQREIEAQIHESLEHDETRSHVQTPEPRQDKGSPASAHARPDNDSEGQGPGQVNGRATDNGDRGRRLPPPPPPRTRPASTPGPQSASAVESPSSAGHPSPSDGNTTRHQSSPLHISTGASLSNFGSPTDLRRRAPGPPPARPPPPPPPKSPSKRPPPPPPPPKKRSSLPLSAKLAELRAREGDVFSFPLGHSPRGALGSPLTLDCEDATESLLQPPLSAHTTGGKSMLVSPLDPHPPTIFVPPLPRRPNSPPPGISPVEGQSRDFRGPPPLPPLPPQSRPPRRTPPPPPPPRNAANLVAGRSGRGAFAARHQLLNQMASSSTSSLDATTPEAEEQAEEAATPRRRQEEPAAAPATPHRRPPVYSRSPQPWPSRAPAVSNGIASNHNHSPDSEPPTASSPELVTPVAPTAAPHEVPEDAEVTDLDVFVSRLEGTGREYEGLNRVTEFVGGATEAGASPVALATLIRAPVVEMQRRVNKDGRVKLKLAVLDVRVSNCPICLSQFRRDELAVVLPRCGHVSHESCARRWFNESSLCMVCRTPLGDE